MPPPDDYLIFGPDDVDLSRSPLRASLGAPTFVLGAFNPGFTRLPSGNLLLMVRVAEALVEPVFDDHVRAIRWTPAGYRLEPFPIPHVEQDDPRKFTLKGGPNRLLALTSLSWLLPVELDPDGRKVIAVHYDKAVEPAAPYQDYGVEDARISRVDDAWYMTVCSVSAERHATCLYLSRNGLDYELLGLVLDHQNKDMLLFEGRVAGRFLALTRPLGEAYFAWPHDSLWAGGPSINLAQSPDALHWRPVEGFGIRARKDSTSANKVGGGTPPVLTPHGWLMLYHGVETRGVAGVYRTFWALLHPDDPTRILRIEDEAPLLEAAPDLTIPIADRLYLDTPVAFTTGIVDAGEDWLLASGEGDLACRLTRIPKSRFA
ncbi:glycosidase [Caulobacter mirabilis]|uniref:Glycosidase n=1 Tax=Caulobacter mirabilis TaxID=69666 RepID=A0A2D2B2G8_9CAUL|nr:glycosidase [Caulobacter mirabilis]ATQ44417.1 glycosidase [Caulobacter mirabilis]